MTVLGKILVFVVLVLSLLWTFLTASTFAARTNWQDRAKKYQEEAQKAGTAATNMKGLLDAERDVADERVRVIKEDRDRYLAQVQLIKDERDKLKASLDAQLATNQKVTAEQGPLLGRAEKLAAEVALKDDQIRKKDEDINRLTLSEQAAVVRANERANEAKAQKERADRLADDVKRLSDQIETIKLSGGRPTVAGSVRVPAPSGFRASVTGIDQISGVTYITINQGLDAGLQKNTELTLQRLTGGGQYLGRLLITQVDPKQAIGTFIPPAGRRLTPADLPRSGDQASGSN
jgi:hypothetical protein